MQVTIFYLLSHVKRQHLDCSNERTGPFAAIHVLHSKHHFSKKEKPKRKPCSLKENKLYSTSQAATLLFPMSLTQSLLIQAIRTTAPYLSRLQLKSCFQHYTQLCTTDSCTTREFHCCLVNLDNSYFLAEV